MLAKKRQLVGCCIILVLAFSCLLYGALFNSRPVYPKDKVKPFVEPELALIQEVTVGGVALDRLGQLRQTYTDKPLDFCPT